MDRCRDIEELLTKLCLGVASTYIEGECMITLNNASISFTMVSAVVIC